MTLSKWKGITATEAFYSFFAYCGDYVIIDSKFNFWLFPLIMDGLRLLEGFVIITAHLKSFCKRFSSFSMYDFDSELTVRSSIKAFINGTGVSSVLRRNISITKKKIKGEMSQPIIMPMFNFCQFEEYLALENLLYVHL